MWRMTMILAFLTGCHVHHVNDPYHHHERGVVVVEEHPYEGEAYVGYQPAPLPQAHVYVGSYHDPFGEATTAQNGAAWQLQQSAIDEAYSAARAGAYMAQQERERREALEAQLAQTREQLEAARRNVATLKADKKTSAAQLAAAQGRFSELETKYQELAADFAASATTPEAAE